MIEKRNFNNEAKRKRKRMYQGYEDKTLEIKRINQNPYDGFFLQNDTALEAIRKKYNIKDMEMSEDKKQKHIVWKIRNVNKYDLRQIIPEVNELLPEGYSFEIKGF